jgi:hypothetical protein
MRWRRTIIEYMPDLLAPHATSIIGKYNYFVPRERLIEARPPCAGIELRTRFEELISACRADIDPSFIIIPILVCE